MTLAASATWPNDRGQTRPARARPRLSADALPSRESGLALSYPAVVATKAPAGDLRDQARALPDAPGVYVWRTEDGTVLYVGKAASLRKRVASYFASVNRDRKSEELVARAASIEPIVV